MKNLIFLLVFLSSFFVTAQEDLFNMLENNEPIYVSYLFKGTKIVNAHDQKIA